MNLTGLSPGSPLEGKSPLLTHSFSLFLTLTHDPQISCIRRNRGNREKRGGSSFGSRTASIKNVSKGRSFSPPIQSKILRFIFIVMVLEVFVTGLVVQANVTNQTLYWARIWDEWPVILKYELNRQHYSWEATTMIRYDFMKIKRGRFWWLTFHLVLNRISHQCLDGLSWKVTTHNHTDLRIDCQTFHPQVKNHNNLEPNTDLTLSCAAAKVLISTC